MILGAQNVKPKEFAQQISLSMENCWGIVRAIVDLIMGQEDGKYLLVKVGFVWRLCVLVMNVVLDETMKEGGLWGCVMWGHVGHNMSCMILLLTFARLCMLTMRVDHAC